MNVRAALAVCYGAPLTLWDEAAVEKIVEAYAGGELIASYHVLLAHRDGEPATDAEYIAEAKKDHAQDGLAVDVIDNWVVRPRPA